MPQTPITHEPHFSDLQNTLLSGEIDLLRDYLLGRYSGVFSEQVIERHVADYVGFVFAKQAMDLVAGHAKRDAKILDIGSGFGSFILLARENGFDAVGIEIAGFEVDFARKRLKHVRPQDDADQVYRLGDATRLDFLADSVDIVTCWNVLEHLPDPATVLGEVNRVLKPLGTLLVICPNYAAFRREAHYLVPWLPFFPRTLASQYLRWLGRDPTYFENSIFYRTNWGLLRALTRLDFEVFDLEGAVKMDLALNNLRGVIRHINRFLTFYNPIRSAVFLAARKRRRA